MYRTEKDYFACVSYNIFAGNKINVLMLGSKVFFALPVGPCQDLKCHMHNTTGRPPYMYYIQDKQEKFKEIDDGYE